MEVADSVDTLANLEERITRAVQIIASLRSENEDFRKRISDFEHQAAGIQAERDESHALNEEFQKENTALEDRLRRLTEETETLRDERKQVKNRIEKLLSQLDLLSAS